MSVTLRISEAGPDELSGQIVSLGSRVVLEDLDEGVREEYVLVSSAESNPAAGGFRASRRSGPRSLAIAREASSRRARLTGSGTCGSSTCAPLRRSIGTRQFPEDSSPATRDGATVVWDGHDVLLLGGYVRCSPSPLPWKLARTLFALRPDRQPLAPTRRHALRTQRLRGRVDEKAAAGLGRHDESGRRCSPPRGFAYDPTTDRWSTLPRAPLRGRIDPTAVWTGRTLIVWGGGGLPHYRSFTDGALLTPATP